MKIVMIAGNSGSGGLIGYIKGLLSYDYNPNDFEIVLYCGKQLAKELESISNSVKIKVTNYATEKTIDIICNRPLHPKLIEQIHYEDPDLVFFLNGYIRKGLEVYPNIMTLHNQLHIDTHQLIRFGFKLKTITLFAIRRVVRKSMVNSDGVIFLSEFSKRQTDEKNIKYKNGVVIPFGFEEKNRIDDVKARKFYNKIKLIYISALYPYKNHINLVRALSKLKKEGYDIELSLVGEKKKPYFKRIEKEIKKNGLESEIIIHNWVEHQNIKHMIDQSNIFVYSSSTETTGYGLLEGMARGALIASSDQAGFPEMLKDGGIYFNPYSVSSIKSAIKKIIHLTEEDKYKMREKAHEYSKEFSWKKTAGRHLDYFKHILNK